MFNGLVKDFGKIIANSTKELKILSNLKVNFGESIAINGACLSVTKYDKNSFCVDLSSESANILALENFSIGSVVHLEPALCYGSKIDGHLMQGHIDGLGIIKKIEKKASGSDFFISLPDELLPFVAKKGSIGIDGISLTISDINKNIIRLSLIPITLKSTLFGEFKANRRVHIETDLLSRYVARILEFKTKKQHNLSWEEAELYTKLF